MRKITYYKLDGSLDHEEELDLKTIKNINGMLSRFHMMNGGVIEGFADTNKIEEGSNLNSDVQNCIHSWTWDNLDENTHQLIGDTSSMYNQTFVKMQIDQIDYIESILHSNPRWGGKLTNKFYC